MKAFAVSFSLTLISLIAFGQNLKPVSWEFKVNQIEDGSYEFIAKAKMKANWAIYSQHTSKGGPIPLAFSYEEGVELIGDTQEESEAIKKMSDLFEIEVIKFKKEAVFTQNFNPKEGQSSIKGTLRYMSCDDSRCLPPTEVAFDVAL